MPCLHQTKEVQFWHLLQPSFYLGVIFGGMHLSLDSNQTNHPFHGSTLGVLWSITYLGFTFYIAYAFITYFIQFATSDTLGSSLEDNVVVYTVICSQIVMTGLHIVVSLLKPRQTLMCLNTSYKVFSHLHLKICRRTLEVALTPTIFAAWFLISSLVVICLRSRIGFPEGLSYIVFFTPIAIEGLAGVLHFIVEAALEGVNDDLEDVRNCLQKEGADFMTPGHIEVLRLKHKMVCDLAEVVDARFGLDLLAGVTMKIVQVIPLIFFGVLLLDWESLGGEILLVWTHLLFVVTRVCYSCYRCELVKKQGRVENNSGKTTLRTLDRDSNLNLPVVGSLVYYESSALDHVEMCVAKVQSSNLYYIVSSNYREILESLAANKEYETQKDSAYSTGRTKLFKHVCTTSCIGVRLAALPTSTTWSTAAEHTKIITYRTRIILQRLNQSYLEQESKEEIVGAVTTYLVILIQFRPNLNNKTGGGVDNHTRTTVTP
uniref:Gustatory receptor n=1 Tax=Timema genevievae TaxID=629358 RepID=A0A7R9JVV9_TIMGE|nr:unnamed protein product [Timema genevievae]